MTQPEQAGAPDPQLGTYAAETVPDFSSVAPPSGVEQTDVLGVVSDEDAPEGRHVLRGEPEGDVWIPPGDSRIAITAEMPAITDEPNDTEPGAHSEPAGAIAGGTPLPQRTPQGYFPGTAFFERDQFGRLVPAASPYPTPPPLPASAEVAPAAAERGPDPTVSVADHTLVDRILAEMQELPNIDDLFGIPPKAAPASAELSPADAAETEANAATPLPGAEPPEPPQPDLVRLKLADDAPVTFDELGAVGLRETYRRPSGDSISASGVYPDNRSLVLRRVHSGLVVSQALDKIEKTFGPDAGDAIPAPTLDPERAAALLSDWQQGMRAARAGQLLPPQATPAGITPPAEWQPTRDPEPAPASALEAHPEPIADAPSGIEIGTMANPNPEGFIKPEPVASPPSLDTRLLGGVSRAVVDTYNRLGRLPTWQGPNPDLPPLTIQPAARPLSSTEWRDRLFPGAWRPPRTGSSDAREHTAASA